MTENLINNILMEMAFLDNPPSPDADLKDDLGIDSLRAVELIIKLENQFNILIDETDLEPQKIKTVNDLKKLINMYLI